MSVKVQISVQASADPRPKVAGVKRKASSHSLQASECSSGISQCDAEAAQTPRVLRPFCAAQSVHSPMLSFEDESGRAGAETLVPVAHGRTKEYCDWWYDQVRQQEDVNFGGVRLIGNCNSPQEFTTMAMTDLVVCGSASYCNRWVRSCNTAKTAIFQLPTGVCSDWGYNRIPECSATEPGLQLTMPVLTNCNIVQAAVAGMLSGSISLSLQNAEATLVLANAAGVSQLFCFVLWVAG